MKYKCIIFDCDGVLVDSEAISAQVFKDMARDLGLSLSLDQAIREFSGKAFHSIVSYIDERIEGDIPEDFEVLFRQKTFAAFNLDLTPIDGVHKVLNALSVPFCVASSGPREKIVLNLTKTELIGHFPEQHIFSSFDIGSWKPDPKIYLYTADKMGFLPEECAIVEDSIYGVKAAIDGGFDTFAYCAEHDGEAYSRMGATVFNDMQLLLGLLNG